MTFLVLIFCGLPCSASAYYTTSIEAYFGATNVVATAGSGSVTVGVSPDGDLAVFSWPSPSYYDHLHYLSSNAPDVRDRPRNGALEGMGAFSGVEVTLDDGSTNFEWLRAASWEREVTFTADDSSVILTTFRNESVGLTVRQYDVVPDGRDVFFRRYVVERDDESVRQVALLSYANLSPSQSKIPQMPIADFAFDQFHDFAALWDEGHDSIVQFHPADNGTIDGALQVANLRNVMRRDFGTLDALFESQMIEPTSVANAVASLDTDFDPGVYVTMSTVPAPTEFQIGEDATQTCEQVDLLADNITSLLESGENAGFTVPSDVVDVLRCGAFDPVQTPREENQWEYPAAQDAYEDAQDGQLSGAQAAAAQVNTALKTELTFEGNVAEGAMVFAFGSTHADSRAELDWARAQELSEVQASVEANDRQWIESLSFPEGADPAHLAFSKRAFLNLRAGTDRTSKAIVASIARQPSYHVDWPRDGVFFNVALDLAGAHDLVEERLAFYARVMRKESIDPTPILNAPVPGWPDDPLNDDFPAGSWEMNYYADGTPGGNIRLEIDNTALLVWNFVEHAGYIDDEAERRAYLERFWPTIKASAGWLADWRDPETGLIWPSNEDDHQEYTQGIQGCGTTFAALRAAAMAATYLGHADEADEWAGRARELHGAMLEHLTDPSTGELVSMPPWGEREAGVPTAWIAWPMRILPYEDPRLQASVDTVLQKQLARIRGETQHGQYPTKAATSASLMYAGDRREATLEIVDTLVDVIADQNTWTIGEAWANDDADGDGVVDRRVNVQATPHLWSQILVFISLYAYHEPQAFDRYMDVLPAVDVYSESMVDDEADMGTPTEQPDAGTSRAAPMGDVSGGCAAAGLSRGTPTLPLVVLLGLIGCCLGCWRRKHILRVRDSGRDHDRKLRGR